MQRTVVGNLPPGVVEIAAVTSSFVLLRAATLLEMFVVLMIQSTCELRTSSPQMGGPSRDAAAPWIWDPCKSGGADGVSCVTSGSAAYTEVCLYRLIVSCLFNHVLHWGVQSSISYSDVCSIFYWELQSSTKCAFDSVCRMSNLPCCNRYAPAGSPMLRIGQALAQFWELTREEKDARNAKAKEKRAAARVDQSANVTKTRGRRKKK